MDPIFAPIQALLAAFAVLGGGALLIAGGVVIAPRLIAPLRQRAYERVVDAERVGWLLRLDPATAGDADAARRLVSALHPGGRRGVSHWASGWPSLTLAVRWVDRSARWEIEAPRQLARQVEAAVAAAYPDAELDRIEAGAAIHGLCLGVRGHAPEAPPRSGADFGAILVEVMSRLPRGGHAAWILRVWPQPNRHHSDSDAAPGWGEILLDAALSRPSRTATPMRASSTSAVFGPSFSVTATLEAWNAPAASLRAWLFDALGAVGTLRASGWRTEATVGGRSAPMSIGPTELAELWGLSGAASEQRAVEISRSRRLAPLMVAPGPGLRPIGLDGGRPVLVPERLFDRHVVLLGRTGSGKSTELVALAADDLRAGRGFTLIDPHGDAVARLLDSVPPDQAGRVHLLELAEKEHPRGFNPIELDDADPEIVAAQFVDTMRDLYFAHLSAPPHRQLHYLRSALMTLLTKPPGRNQGPWTLASLHRLFIDPAFREEVLMGLDDPLLTAFWQHQWSAKGRLGADPSADALIGKLSAFLSYPSIRAIVSAPTSTIRPRRVMDSGEVLLVDLSRAGGDNAWLFGGLVIARFYVDALARQNMPPSARVPHALYVDEVHNFDTSALRGITSEGRKFALRLVTATQYLASLGGELQRAIRANVATLALLQPSSEDARAFRDEMSPLTERDLLNMPRFRMAIRTELDGDARVLTADVLPEPPRLGSGAMVRRISDARDVRDGEHPNGRGEPRQ